MVDQLIELYSSGLTVNQIAVETGIYNQKVKKLLQEAGVYGTAPEMLSEHHDEIVKLCGEGINYQEIAKQVGTSRWKVVEYCKKNGLYERTKVEPTPELNEEILRLYQEGVSSLKIAKQVGVSKWYVLQVIPQEEKKTKAFYNKYTCNYSFFENIDTEIKAYFLGLFYADGYNNEEVHAVKIGFAKADRELLSKFMEAIGSNHKVTEYERGGNTQTFYSVSINSKILSDDLARHGCVQAKTHLLEGIPEMEESLVRHFIRGYFDGDGSVWHSLVGDTRDKINLSFTGNKPFLLKVQEVLVRELGIGQPNIYIRHKERNNDIGDLRYAYEPARKILEWMYNDCQYYSERKKEISLKQKFEEQLM